MKRNDTQHAETADQHTGHRDTAQVRLRFAQLKVAFTDLGIRQPLVFIQWRHPELSADAIRRIRMGLTGRAASADGHLADVVQAVVEHLKAA